MPTTETATPKIVDYPRNNYDKSTAKPDTNKTHEKINSDLAETVASVIGIIAGILITIILIILIILKIKSRNEHSYKVDDGKGFAQGPNAALLGSSSTNGQTQYQINGALRNGDKGQSQKSKKRDSKDIKEWYV